ncbi:MAG: RNA repair transcriptional activator RtcR family protein, partial [Syntrophales bacterium]|nr:RNA repair transcriptional activator RtcR family protein [Syntrophales bacterium]
MTTGPRILLTFNGAQDPVSSRTGKPGPILTLLGERPFDEVHLFCNNELSPQGEKTKGEITARYNIPVHLHFLDLPDPTDYEAILTQIRTHLPSVLGTDRGGDYFINVSPGTPQMHACWLLLAASGEIPANVLHVRQPDRARPGEPLITEVNPRASALPILGRP